MSSVETYWERRKPALVGSALWCVLTLIALVITLVSLEDDADGLSYLLQFPFMFPWFFPIASGATATQTAWILAGLGFLNAFLIYLLFSRLHDRRRGG